MSTDPALASRSARGPESLDKVTNAWVLLVAGEIQLPTYPCHFGRSNSAAPLPQLARTKVVN